MNRQEWLEWRKQGIGSSDAPAIMGVSPWKTKFRLWEEKLSQGIFEESSYILDKGNRMEPKIRALYEFQRQMSFTPALCESENFRFMRASLDGRSEDKTEIIEIKLVGKEDFENASKGKTPEKYWPQVQHQLMVSGAQLCHLLCYCDADKSEEIKSENLAVIVVRPDAEYMEQLFKAEVAFWDLVQAKKPPEICDDDYKILKGHAKLANQWKRLKQKAHQIEAELEKARDALIAAAEESKHPRLMVAGVKITKQYRSGNINYKAVPQLQGVDLEPYRGKPSSFWKVDV